jgi:hypothetical protein
VAQPFADLLRVRTSQSLAISRATTTFEIQLTGGNPFGHDHRASGASL